MSKAILVMDMPKNCAECSLCNCQDCEHFCIPDDFTHYLCGSFVSHNGTERPEWCPLKEVPQKKEDTLLKLSVLAPLKLTEYAQGYNDCIDELINDSKATKPTVNKTDEIIKEIEKSAVDVHTYSLDKGNVSTKKVVDLDIVINIIRKVGVV